MHCITRVIKYQGDPWFTLTPLGDIHDGTIHCDRNLFLKDLQTVIDDPYGLTIGMGDHHECIIPTDPRFSADEVDPYYLQNGRLATLAVEQKNRFVDTMLPVAEKCIGLLTGNHEHQIKQRHYIDLTDEACKDLSGGERNNKIRAVPFLGDASLIRLVFQRVDDNGNQLRSHNVIIYAEHGAGGGGKTGGKVNSLEDKMRDFDADIYLRGHVHTKLTTKHPRLTITRQGKPSLQAKTRICGLTGTYYRTYQQDHSSYGQRKSYSPTELGCIKIRIRPNTGEMEAVS